MPTLDFKCNQCGHKFEELVLSSHIEKIKCPKCGTENLSRVYEGKWMFGSHGSSGCDGKSCATCSGCKH